MTWQPYSLTLTRMIYAQTLLEHNKSRSTRTTNIASRDQSGRWVELSVRERGITAWTLARLLQWVPSFGRSRWMIETVDGVRLTVNADRLRLVRSVRVPLPEDSEHLKPLTDDQLHDTPGARDWPPPPWTD